MLSSKNAIYNRRPSKEDANSVGLVQYYRCDFRAWYFGYWDDRRARHDGWLHCENWTPPKPPNEDGFTADLMHEARRPKPPDLKQQALKDLDLLMADLRTLGMGLRDTNIRRALED